LGWSRPVGLLLAHATGFLLTEPHMKTSYRQAVFP
jgi:hypothetical protein